ncbi:Acidic endochitinase SP2 [Smittium culicis]|uniref:Acidic endochitinase SP2 n=1 Tax=Smittium culicis TaxID=133412 RepID=A0A1R1YFW0_9FUNG|nr:Acidic endochitinase SP2 [Smittium culicis]
MYSSVKKVMIITALVSLSMIPIDSFPIANNYDKVLSNNIILKRQNRNTYRENQSTGSGRNTGGKSSGSKASYQDYSEDELTKNSGGNSGNSSDNGRNISDNSGNSSDNSGGNSDNYDDEGSGKNNANNSNSGGSSNGQSGGSSGEIDCNKFNQAVTSAGYGQPSSDKCQAFLNGFSIGGISNNVEAAMFLSQILWESDGLSTKEEYYCKTNDCSSAYASASDVSGKVYGGRGYIQLTWSSNYAAASKAIYGDDRLLKNPELVSASEDASWAVSFWYWSAIVKTDSGISQGKFGSSTNMINGALECRGSNTDKAKKRFEIYKKVLAVFSPGTTPNESGCYN